MKNFFIISVAILIIQVSVCIMAEPVVGILNSPGYSDLYDVVTAEIKLPYIKRDPDRPGDIKVDAVIITPSGTKMNASLFCETNTIEEGSLWRLRFTPVEAGRFHCYFKIETASIKEETDSFTFGVMKKDKKGFLRRSRNNPYYLVFDSGEPYFGIGHNIAWVYNSSLKVFERYFSLLAKNGGNLSRVWICSWSFPLEWGKLGEYDQRVCEKMDELLKIAEKKGIYIILTLDTYGSLMPENGVWNENDWEKNPYNKKNGGPCENPEDFFRDSKAISHYKNKLRYVLARWGYSPNILAIELWNEYNAPVKWVKEITSFLRENDCHGHFITTSHGYPWGKAFDEESIWKLDGISMITGHIYTASNINGSTPVLKQATRNIADNFKKPFIISEYGIDASKSDKETDPEGKGTSLHNSIWVTALSKSFGTAMNWWWDDYIRPKGLYGHYRSLALFLSDVNWDSGKVEYVDISPVSISGQKPREAGYRYVRITPENKWGKAKTGNIIISNEGGVTGLSRPNKYLHGNIKEEMKADHIFKVNYPVPGEFIIKVGKVSQDGHLYAYLDGKLVKDRVFPCGKGKGPWKGSFYNKEYDIYQCLYNEEFKIKVPAGKHVIKLKNNGTDWISIERITLTNYMPVDLAGVYCLGLEVGGQRLFWIQNRDFNWNNTLRGQAPDTVDNAGFYIYNVQNGSYRLEWWDTFKGIVTSVETVQAKEGKLHINIPSFFRDIACKIKKV